MQGTRALKLPDGRTFEIPIPGGRLSGTKQQLSGAFSASGSGFPWLAVLGGVIVGVGASWLAIKLSKA